MKRILIVCLLGMGLLLPVQQLTAMGFSFQRIVDVFMEDAILIASSESETGTLKSVTIKDSEQQVVLQEDISGYYDTVDLSSLRPGSYTAYVTTTLTSYSEGININ